MNSAAMKFLHMSLREYMDEFLLGRHLGVEFIDFMNYFMGICMTMYTYTDTYLHSICVFAIVVQSLSHV